MIDRLRMLSAHLRWADERALESLTRAAVPEPALVELLAHVLGAEHVWLARAEGRAPTVAVWPALTLAESAALAAENHAAFDRLLDTLDASQLSREVTYTNSAGAEFRSRVDDMLVQMLLHGAYHRGQIAFGLRRAGAEPIATDYIAFVRGAAAAVRAAPSDGERLTG